MEDRHVVLYAVCDAKGGWIGVHFTVKAGEVERTGLQPSASPHFMIDGMKLGFELAGYTVDVLNPLRGKT